MKNLVAITLREMNDHKQLVGGAAVAAIFPLVLPFLPGFGSTQGPEVRGVAGIVVALALTWIFAAVLGPAMIGNELAQGRLGFFFARPVSGQAIWWGKLLGNMLLILLCQVVILAPAVVVSFVNGLGFDSLDGSLWPFLVVFIGVPLFVILLTHTLNIMVKSRSPWLALDATACLLVIAGCWLALKPLMILTFKGFYVGLSAVIVLTLVALLLAGSLQVSIGRTDLQRGHRALSIGLWAALLPTTFAALVFSYWIRSSGPDDLRDVRVLQTAPAGSWIVVTGPTTVFSDYSPDFLYDTASKRHFTIDNLNFGVAFSADGTTASWFTGSDINGRQLVSLALDRDPATVQRTPLIFAGSPQLALSPNGEMVAVLDHTSISVHDLETGRVVNASRLDEGRSYGKLYFANSTTVRIHASIGGRPDRMLSEIFELDLVHGKLEQTGHIDGLENGWVFLDSTKDRLIMTSGFNDDRHWTQCDARSGLIIKELGTTDAYRASSTLSDGTFVRGGVDGGQAWIDVFSPESDAAHRILIAKAARIYPRGEAAPGIITVSVTEDPESWDPGTKWTSFAVNVTTGTVTAIPGVGRPATTWWDPTRTVNPINSRLFNDSKGSLLLWNPEDGTVETLIEAKE